MNLNLFAVNQHDSADEYSKWFLMFVDGIKVAFASVPRSSGPPMPLAMNPVMFTSNWGITSK